jgi:D-alanine-D-alanine ligase
VRLGFTYNMRSLDRSAPQSPPEGRGLIGLADDAEEEFDSPQTIDAIAGALRSLGHEVELLGDGAPLLRRLVNPGAAGLPDLVFNMAEGTGVGRSREARVPAVLEMLGIPHTGSDPLTLALALDKPMAKAIVAAAGVAVPGGVVVEPVGLKSKVQNPKSPLSDFGPWTLDLGRNGPLIAKPAFEGSSKGILGKCLIEDRSKLADVVSELLQAYHQPILVEEFIDGEELTVGVLGNSPPQVLGVMRVVPRSEVKNFIYSLEVKREFTELVRYECPAAFSPKVTAAVEQAALAAYRALGCRDVARIDFRLRDGVPYFIEANPLPGLAPGWSDLVILASALGVEHRELLRRIVAAAAERYGIN